MTVNQYADYTYYTGTFGGTLIPQTKFNKYAIKATLIINNRILGKDITGNESIIKHTCCEVAEILYNQDLSETKMKEVANGTQAVITSEKVGDYSRNFSSAGINELKQVVSDANTEINTVIDENLLLTGLLYSGVECVR